MSDEQLTFDLSLDGDEITVTPRGDLRPGGYCPGCTRDVNVDPPSGLRDYNPVRCRDEQDRWWHSACLVATQPEVPWWAIPDGEA